MTTKQRSAHDARTDARRARQVEPDPREVKRLVLKALLYQAGRELLRRERVAQEGTR